MLTKISQVDGSEASAEAFHCASIGKPVEAKGTHRGYRAKYGARAYTCGGGGGAVAALACVAADAAAAAAAPYLLKQNTSRCAVM